MEELYEYLKGFKILEMFKLEDGDEIPFYVIISEDSEKIQNALQEHKNLEADVAVLNLEEKKKIFESNSEIAQDIKDVINNGLKLV
jgi:Glu-tRNA(Gln) amidotransferase subunit E-like FAD-binding protein